MGGSQLSGETLGAFVRSLSLALLLMTLIGCGAKQIYLEQEAALPVGKPDLERFVYVVDVERINPEGSVDFVTYMPGCLDGSQLHAEAFTLRPGEAYRSDQGQTFVLLCVDQDQQTVVLRGSEYVEVKNGLLPRKRHPLEKPAPNPWLQLTDDARE